MTDLSIIIPSYNEYDNIESLLMRLLSVLETNDIDGECIVIDDDSPDRTWQVVESKFGSNPRVNLIRRTEESGLGSAVVRGIEHACGEFIGVMDADLQHPPERVPDFYSAFEPNVDLVVGTRRATGGEIVAWSMSRQIVSQGARLLAYVIFPGSRQLSDPMSGFFMFRASCVDPAKLDPTGFKILLEIIGRCDMFEIIEVSYVFGSREHGESKLTRMEYLRYIEHLLRLGMISRGLDRHIDPTQFSQSTKLAIVGLTGSLVIILIFLFAL
jgi:dolichol-phosphate mannosyltransferase